jgi:phosphatidylglycerophosphatase A
MPTTASTPSRPEERAPRRLGLAVWLATGGGIGFIPWAPGTFGTLLGLPLAWAIWLLPLWGRAPAILGLVAIGVPICSAAARRLGRKDPGAVVWDEIAAVPVTFAALSFDRSPGSLAAVLALGFVLFRVFDILKPPPARWLERLPHGWGIMADDLAAAVYAGACLHLLAWLAGL